MSDEALACPNCGKPQRNNPPLVSLSRQIIVYSVSLFLPPFGLWYARKYLKQKDSKSRKIGVAALILTIASAIVTIWLTEGVMNSISQTLNFVNINSY